MADVMVLILGSVWITEFGEQELRRVRGFYVCK